MISQLNGAQTLNALNKMPENKNQTAQKVDRESGVEMDKIAQWKNRIESGEYQPDPEATAKAMARFLMGE